jgi:hypothetical protein
MEKLGCCQAWIKTFYNKKTIKTHTPKKLKEIADSKRDSKLRHGVQLTSFTNNERGPKITEQTPESFERKKVSDRK